MIRLCFALGTWQLITLAAALKQDRLSRGDVYDGDDYLALHGPEATENLRKSMEQLGGRVWSWSRVYWHTALDQLCHPASCEEWPLPIADYVAILSKGIDAPHVEEVWLPHIYNIEDRLVLEAFPNARVMLYEDGVFVSAELYKRTWKESIGLLRVAPGLLARGKFSDHIRSLDIMNWRLAPRYLRRVDTLNYYLLYTLPKPNPFQHVQDRRVEADVLRETVAVASDVFASELDDVRKLHDPVRDVLLLGQSLYRGGLMQRQDELKFYTEVACELIDKGYRVCWKGHPREPRSMYCEIASGVASDQIIELQLDPAVPVETLGRLKCFKACVSGYSASLFYMSSLYGVETYSLVKQMMQVDHKVDQVALNLVAEKIPGLEKLVPFSQDCC